MRSWLLLAILALPLLGCAGESRDTLRFGLASAPISLDPRYATDATSARINRLLYRSLVDFDESSKAVPSLATWTVLTPTHYRFVLGEEGRVFQDGSRLDATDVKATYESVLDPSKASPQRASISMIQRIDVLDKDTIDFYLDHPDPLFPGYLVIGIVPAKAIAAEHPFEDRPMGSGPFAFDAWPSEGRLVLKRRTDGQRVEFIHVQDATVRVLKLLRGEIDMMQNDLPKELVSYLSRQSKVRVQRREGSNFTYIGFNLQDPVLSHLEVREAIAYAIDRQAIARYVLGGETRLAGAMLPPHHWAGNPTLSGYDYDPALARQLLKKVGYSKEHPLELTYKTSSDPFRIRIATIIQRQLDEVGIRVKLQSYDWATFYGDIKAGRFQMYSLSWVGVKSPDIFRYAFYSSSIPPKGANRGHYASATADRLIDAAAHGANLQERAQYYRELQSYLLKSLPCVPLWYEEHFFAARRDIRGYRLAADGNYDGLISVYRAQSAGQGKVATAPPGHAISSAQ